MEIELKYKIPTDAVAADIWKDKIFSDMEEEDSREEVSYGCQVFRYLSLRPVKEADCIPDPQRKERWVAALKCNGTNEGALHKRIEDQCTCRGRDTGSIGLQRK